MIKYAFAPAKTGTIKNVKDADAQALGECIAELGDEHNGEIRPRHLWQAARNNPDHPAHKHFEWDVEKAAKRHWDDQARSIIRAIVPLNNQEEPMDLPAFIHVTQPGSKCYRKHTEVLKSRDMKRIVLEKAKQDAIAFQIRYQMYAEIFEAMNCVRTAIDNHLENAD